MRIKIQNYIKSLYENEKLFKRIKKLHLINFQFQIG